MNKIVRFTVVIVLLSLIGSSGLGMFAVTPATDSDSPTPGEITHEISGDPDAEIDGDIEMTSSRSSEESRVIYNPIIADERVEYAIITASEFVDELTPLAQWKTRKGIGAKIFTLEDIYGQFTGRDKAEQLHKFLRDLNSKSSYLKWVLLAGDDDANQSADNPPIPNIPSRYLFTGGGSYGVSDYYWSDVYFAGLGGNWDNDNDGIYGEFGTDHPYSPGTGTKGDESHLDFDVYVGRLPGNTGTEMTTMVNKILTYEKDPPVSDWMKTFVIWGGLMDAPNVGTYDNDSHNAYEVQNERVKPLIPTHMRNNIKEYYDYPKREGGTYSPATDNLDRSNAIASMNAGASIINFAGQAYYEGWALLDYADSTGQKKIGTPGAYQELYWYTDGSFASNGNKLPLVYLSGCDAAVFHNTGGPTYTDRSQERLLTNTNGGAIGLISSTGKTYRGEENHREWGNWWMDEHFFKIMFESGVYQPGKALYDLKEKYTKDIENGDGRSYPKPIRSNTYGYVLLGDPELNIWTDEPKQLSVDIENLYVGTGEAVFTVTDDITGAPVEGALVNLMGNALYRQGYTNETGVCKIPIDQSSPGQAEVIITAHNYYPREIDSLSFIQKPVDLVVEASDISLWPEVSVPLHGSELTVLATIHNNGGTALSASTIVRFYLDDPQVDGVIFGDDQYISDINPLAYTTVSETWFVEYRPEPYEIYVVIDPDNTISEHSEINNRAFISVSVRTSDLMIESSDLRFIPDSVVGEKQGLTLNVTINNIGFVDAKNFKVRFFDGDPGSGGVPIPLTTGEDIIVPIIFRNSSTTVEGTFYRSGGNHEIFVFVDAFNETFEMDESNNKASRSITVNYAPVLRNLNDITVDEDRSKIKVFDLQAIKYSFDKDNDTSDLIYSISDSGSEYLTVTITENRYVNIYPAENFSSTEPIMVTVQATDMLSIVTATFNVTVRPENDPPAIEPILELTVESGQYLNYTVNATDSEGDVLGYSVDTDMFEIDPGTGLISFKPDDNDTGTYQITVTVSDGDLQTSIVFTLKVLPRENLAPVLEPIKDIVLYVGEAFRTMFHASDPDGDTLTFRMDPPLFSLSKYDSTSAEFSLKPSGDDVGEYTVFIVVSDGLETDEQEITITIKERAKDEVKDGFELSAGARNWIIIIIVVIIVIVLLVFLLIRRKAQIERDLKAWESKDSFEPRSRFDRTEGRETFDRTPGERSIIEEELLGKDSLDPPPASEPPLPPPPPEHSVPGLPPPPPPPTPKRPVKKVKKVKKLKKDAGQS